jgi:16S rRNA C1402 (ribose-2'-O) methylase RsmI
MVLTQELKKVHEEVLQEKVSETQNQIAETRLKGEIILITRGKTHKKKSHREIGR